MSITCQSPVDIINNAVNLLKAGDIVKAYALVEAGCNKYPADTQIWLLRARISRELRKYAEVEKCARHVMSLDRNNADALIEYALAKQNQGHVEEAVNVLEKAVALDASSANAHYYLATICLESGMIVRASQHYRAVLDINPNHLESLNNLSAIYTNHGKIQESISLIKRALTIRPNAYHMLNNLARNYLFSGDSLQALEILDKVVILYPLSSEARSKYLLCTNYNNKLDRESRFKSHRLWHSVHGKNVKRYSTYKCKHALDRPLHVGYVSPDLRNHSVAYFIEPIITNHNKDKYIISCYSDVHIPDVTTSRISSSCNHFNYTKNHTNDLLAEKIHDDGVDILVDLAGHTANNRLMVFERRPAPISVSYLGYPNTTGIDCIDYRITDSQADPDGADSFYTEELLRMPEGFLCYQPPADVPKNDLPPSSKSERLIFGSFNNLAKLTPDVIEIWSEILNRVPQSSLMLKSKATKDEYTCSRLVRLFDAQGVASSRLMFAGYTKSTKEHLQMYNHIDVALDTFPYNGTTTTCEALLMGVPVVALLGDDHASRVSGSILTSIGECELIAAGADEYVRIALEIAADGDRLVKYRRELRGKLMVSSLCDINKQVRNIEKLYSMAWKKYLTNSRIIE